MSTSNKVQLDSDTQKKIDTLALQPEVISESDKVIAVIESSNGGPSLAMDKLEESYTRLENAVNKTREAQRNATVASREMTTKLESMNDKFKGLVMQTGDDMSSSESLAQA